MLVEIDHPSAGRITVPGLPVKCSATPGSIRRPPPRLGEHTVEVLVELGIPATEIPRLRREGVI